MSEATLLERTEVEDVVRYSKRCGWCTKYQDTASSYLSRGKIFTIKKPGKRSPSIQIYASDSSYEIKSKGNQHVELDSLLADFPLIADEIQAIVQPALDYRESRSVRWNSRGNPVLLPSEEDLPTIGVVDVLDYSISEEAPDIQYTTDCTPVRGLPGRTTLDVECIASENPSLLDARMGQRLRITFNGYGAMGFVSAIEVNHILDRDDTLKLTLECEHTWQTTEGDQ